MTRDSDRPPDPTDPTLAEGGDTRRDDDPTRWARLGGSLPEERVSSRAVALDAGRTDGPLAVRFAPREAIGEGGMGEVRAYLDARIGREVAIKTMLPEWSRQEDLREAFLREAALQGRLEHPSIVPVHDVGIDGDGRPYFIMKRVRGITLQQILVDLARRNPITEKRYSRRRLLEAFVRVCLTVDFAHEQGVLHRDLKPSNLMLGDFGEVYILDWGLAHVRGEATGMQHDRAVQRSLRLLGTPGYVSPEQITSDSADLDGRSDVYSLGVILYELLTLRRFHGSRDAQAKLDATLAGHVPDLADATGEEDVPPELHAIWRRAVAASPAERYPTARALADDVEAYFEGVRDEEVRHALAERHARDAQAVAVAEVDGPEGAVERRRQAMRLLGRSLALEPNNPKVLRLLYDILAAEPGQLSDEVRVELERAAQQKVKFALSVGGKVMLAWYLAVPLMLWSGVRDVRALAALCAMTALASGTILGCASRPRVTAPMLYACVLFICATVAYGSRWYGPLLFTPSILIPILGAFCMTELRAHRVGFVAIGALTLVVPPVLEGLGVVPASYRFVDGSMAIVPQLVEFPAGPTLATLAAIGVACLVSNALYAGMMRDYLTAAETRAFGLLWSLRQLVPVEAEERAVD